MKMIVYADVCLIVWGGIDTWVSCHIERYASKVAGNCV